MAGFWKRLQVASKVLLRNNTDLVFSDFNDFASWLSGGNETDSGYTITAKKAQKITTVFNCVNVISQDIASMPVDVRQQTNKGRVKIKNSVYRLLHNQSNPYMTAYHFKYAMTFLGETLGQSFAYIERNTAFEPINLWIIDPYKVSIWNEGLEWYYLVNGIRFEAYDILHYRSFTRDGVNGISKIEFNSEVMGLKLKQNNFKAKTLGNRPPGYLTGAVTPEQKLDIIKSWKENANSGGTPFLIGSVEYKQLMLDSKAADIVNSEKWTDQTILGIWRMQPSMISNHERSTFTNSEQQDLSHVKYTLMPVISAWEQECNCKMFTERNKLSENPVYVKFNTNTLLRGDIEARVKYYQFMRTNGIMNANEIRMLEDMELQDDENGNKYFIQGAMIEAGSNVVEATRSVGFQVDEKLKKQKIFDNEK
jgi:HK97 family phage portal protein